MNEEDYAFAMMSAPQFDRIMYFGHSTWNDTHTEQGLLGEPDAYPLSAGVLWAGDFARLVTGNGIRNPSVVVLAGCQTAVPGGIGETLPSLLPQTKVVATSNPVTMYIFAGFDGTVTGVDASDVASKQ